MNNYPTNNPFDDDEAQTRSVRLAILSIVILFCCAFSFFGFRQLQTDPISLYNRYFPSPTSGVVQPAASLAHAARNRGAVVVEVNAEPTPLTSKARYVFHGKSGEILPDLVKAVWNT